MDSASLHSYAAAGDKQAQAALQRDRALAAALMGAALGAGPVRARRGYRRERAVRAGRAKRIATLAGRARWRRRVRVNGRKVARVTRRRPR